MFNAFIFDMDGVLVDTAQLQIDSLHEALEESISLRLTRSEDLDVVKSTITTKAKLIELSNRGYFSLALVDKIYEVKKRIANQMMLSMDPKNSQDKREAFQFLKDNNKKIGIVTNANRDSTVQLLTYIGLYPYLDTLITNSDVTNSKPHAEPYIRGMLKLDSELEKFIIFEDSEVGLISARATGATVVEISSVQQINVEFLKDFVQGGMFHESSLL